MLAWLRAGGDTERLRDVRGWTWARRRLDGGVGWRGGVGGLGGGVVGSTRVRDRGADDARDRHVGSWRLPSDRYWEVELTVGLGTPVCVDDVTFMLTWDVEEFGGEE